MGILSSNSKENIQRFLGMHDGEMFDFVYTAKSIFGKDQTLKKLLKERGYAKEEVLYVGDELRDAEACRKAGIACALVTCGDMMRKSCCREEIPNKWSAARRNCMTSCRRRRKPDLT